jgi:hypothetical protein
MMETIEDIIRDKKPHPFKGYKWSKQYGPWILSIVGGDNSFYGDFNETFEVAIIDSRNRNFVTRRFYGGSDDVLSYVSREEVLKIVTMLEGVPSPKTGVVEAD